MNRNEKPQQSEAALSRRRFLKSLAIGGTYATAASVLPLSLLDARPAAYTLWEIEAVYSRSKTPEQAMQDFLKEANPVAGF